MKLFEKMTPWRFASLAIVSLIIVALFITGNVQPASAGVEPDSRTLDDLSEIDRQTWKSLPYQIRIPVYETFPTEKKKVFWRLKHEELKRLDWTAAELEHIDSFYSVICENPLLLERGAESQDLEDWFEVFRYNWREHAHDVLGWSMQLLYAVSMSGDEVLNTSGELKVYTPINVDIKVWPVTRSSISEICDECAKGTSLQYLPHPDYCNAYYVCYLRMAVAEWCPDGLVFNPAIQMCDFVWNMEDYCL